MALVNPHPALKVSVPMNPMVDGWMGDDWFHNGAFRQQNMPYIYEQVASRDNSVKWWTNYHDDYDLFMQAGSAGELGRRYGMEQLGFWNKMVAHPAYDAFWSDQAVDKVLAAQPLQGAGDAGAQPVGRRKTATARSRCIRPSSRRTLSGDMVKLVMGPWYHGQEIEDGSALGAIRFGSDTAQVFSRAGAASVSGAISQGRRAEGRHRSGHGLRDRHQSVAPPRSLAARPARADARPRAAALYLQPGQKLGFSAPAARRGLCRVRLRSRAPRALPRPAHPADRLRSRADLVAMAGGRSARSLRPHRRADLHLRRADGAGENQRQSRWCI